MPLIPESESRSLSDDQRAEPDPQEALRRVMLPRHDLDLEQPAVAAQVAGIVVGADPELINARAQRRGSMTTLYWLFLRQFVVPTTSPPGVMIWMWVWK